MAATTGPARSLGRIGTALYMDNSCPAFFTALQISIFAKIENLVYLDMESKGENAENSDLVFEYQAAESNDVS